MKRGRVILLGVVIIFLVLATYGWVNNSMVKKDNRSEVATEDNRLTYEEMKVGNKFGNFTLVSKTGGPDNFTLEFSGEAMLSGRYVPFGEYPGVNFFTAQEDIEKLPVIDSRSNKGSFCFSNTEFAANELPEMSLDEVRNLTFNIPDEPVTGSATIVIADFQIRRAEAGGCGESATLIEVISKKQDNAAEQPKPTIVDTPPKPEPEPADGLPYCNNAFKEHHDIASDYASENDFDDPQIADDEWVVYLHTAHGVGRCNNGNTQSTRFLFGYGEVLTDESGNPEAYLGYVVVDGDSSEVSVFENCNENRCQPTEWCTPVYGPSQCSDGKCTNDEAFKGCQ